MHRHAYQGRKLSRPLDQRGALVRGQLTSLVLYEKITTTEAKAKEVAPRFEQLVTKAKRGSLADRRAVATVLTTELANRKLFQELVPAMQDRTSGYTRIIKIGRRRGDNAAMAVLSLVVKPKGQAKAEETSAAAQAATAAEASKAAAAKPKVKPKAGKK
jgi:large subunit ribosomal protein L17